MVIWQVGGLYRVSRMQGPIQTKGLATSRYPVTARK